MQKVQKNSTESTKKYKNTTSTKKQKKSKDTQYKKVKSKRYKVKGKRNKGKKKKFSAITIPLTKCSCDDCACSVSSVSDSFTQATMSL